MKNWVGKLRGSLWLLALGSLATLLEGCCTDKETQLQNVAKDWCLTIRASQIVPVYPMTEDIQPGDIFLVQVPISQQQEVYTANGFLPLDNHIARLNPSGYSKFYSNSFLPECGSTSGCPTLVLPADWIRPKSTNNHAWGLAPHSAFPSYSFSVRRGAGFNLAVPIEGVPVGLSLLGSDAANGSVTIKNAGTIGVDMVSLYNDVTEWAKTNAGFLKQFGASAVENGTNYLRIISRVYATGEMEVSLQDARSRSGGADVGVAKPVQLLFPSLADGTNAADTVASYTNGLSTLNELLQQASSTADGALPGGSLRVVAASSRSVTMSERFDPPVILGYVGFDCAIRENGTLEPPVPTHAHLDRKAKLNRARVVDFHARFQAQTNAFYAIKARYEKASQEQQQEIRKLAGELHLSSAGDGAEWLTGLNLLVDGNDEIKTRQFGELQKQVNELKPDAVAKTHNP